MYYGKYGVVNAGAADLPRRTNVENFFRGNKISPPRRTQIRYPHLAPIFSAFSAAPRESVVG
jgi:hypothetical protein